jgi:hypothetical protein
MKSNQRIAKLRDFFGGLTEHTFEARLGIADPPLIDYLVELLVRFIRTDALLATRSDEGEPLDQVAELVVAAENRVGEAKRAVNRHIGDFTLFWTGVYPEALHHLRAAGRKDHFVDYCEHGKRAYRIASAIPAGPNEVQGEVLERLSYEFDTCIIGLGEVRKEWEQQTPRSGDAPTIWVM